MLTNKLRNLVVLILLSACSSAPASLVSTPSQTSPAATQFAAPQAAHEIGVRQVDGVGEFYVIATNEKFVPRGANYVYFPRGTIITNTPLKVGIYDGQQVRRDFSTLAELGYNSVRVFLDGCSSGSGCIGDDDNIGLNPDYLDNIADMMAAADEAGIYLLVTSNDLPDQGGYSEQANQGSGGDFAGYRNSYYLRPSAVEATRRYWRDLLSGLYERGAAFNAVLGWQLLNEQWMFRDQPPLSLTSGTVETTTGIYNMTNPEEKKQMVTDGLVYYIDQMKDEILKHDPSALVTMGFFVPELVAPEWYVDTKPLLEQADLDFYDFHAYPGDLSLGTQAEAFGMPGYLDKPIVLGEYGAFRHIFADLVPAARAVSNWVADSCELGFDGWFYWAYYPAAASAGDQTWGLVDEDNYLLNLLAPRNQPDPCIPAELQSENLAYGKPTRASTQLGTEPSANAVDENNSTQWGAGAGPVQWIEIDLEALHAISEIRLLVAQYPQGLTVHRIQGRSSTEEPYQLLTEISGVTADADWLIFRPDAPVDGVRYIRIQTVTSPSWVSWKEIQIFE